MTQNENQLQILPFDLSSKDLTKILPVRVALTGKLNQFPSLDYAFYEDHYGTLNRKQRYGLHHISA